MFPEAEFETNDHAWRHFSRAGMGALRVALLFGSAAVALALIAVPIVQNHTRTVVARAAPYGIDHSATGSVAQAGRYTIRRSVLQSSPSAVCIISNSGRHSGDC